MNSLEAAHRNRELCKEKKVWSKTYLKKGMWVREKEIQNIFRLAGFSNHQQVWLLLLYSNNTRCYCIQPSVLFYRSRISNLRLDLASQAISKPRYWQYFGSGGNSAVWREPSSAQFDGNLIPGKKALAHLGPSCTNFGLLLWKGCCPLLQSVFVWGGGFLHLQAKAQHTKLYSLYRHTEMYFN